MERFRCHIVMLLSLLFFYFRFLIPSILALLSHSVISHAICELLDKFPSNSWPLLRRRNIRLRFCCFSSSLFYLLLAFYMRFFNGYLPFEHTNYTKFVYINIYFCSTSLSLSLSFDWLLKRRALPNSTLRLLFLHSIAGISIKRVCACGLYVCTLPSTPSPPPSHVH